MGGQSFSADLAAGARGAPVRASLIPRRSFQATGSSFRPSRFLEDLKIGQDFPHRGHRPWTWPGCITATLPVGSPARARYLIIVNSIIHI